MALRTAAPSGAGSSTSAVPHCAILQAGVVSTVPGPSPACGLRQCRIPHSRFRGRFWVLLQTGGCLRGAPSSAASSTTSVWGPALQQGALWRSASGALRRAEEKSTGPGLEPTTSGSSAQLLNHSDTGARCFPCLHFHSLECTWRFLQPGAGGWRGSAAAAGTSNSPKSKWGIPALEVVALGRAPRRVLASPPGARGTTRSLHVGLCAVSLPLGVGWPPCPWLARSPRCRIPHRGRVPFSSGDGGSSSPRV